MISLSFLPIKTRTNKSIEEVIQNAGAINDNSTCAANTTATGLGIATANPGRKVTFTITSRDSQNVQRKLAGDVFEVKLKPEVGGDDIKVELNDRKDGTYLAEYTVDKLYGKLTLSVCLRGAHINGSPFSVLVEPPRPFADLGKPVHPITVLQEPLKPFAVLQEPPGPFAVEEPPRPFAVLEEPPGPFAVLEEPLGPFAVQWPPRPFAALEGTLGPHALFEETVGEPLRTMPRPKTKVNTRNYRQSFFTGYDGDGRGTRRVSTPRQKHKYTPECVSLSTENDVVYRRRSTNSPYHFQGNFGKKFPTNVS